MKEDKDIVGEKVVEVAESYGSPWIVLFLADARQEKQMLRG